MTIPEKQVEREYMKDTTKQRLAKTILITGGAIVLCGLEGVLWIGMGFWSAILFHAIGIFALLCAWAMEVIST